LNSSAGNLNRRRDIRSIIRDAFAYYRADWRGFVTIGAGTIPFALISSAVQFSVTRQPAQNLALAGVFLLSLPAFALVEGAVISHLTALNTGAPASEARAFAEAARRVGSMTGALLRVVALSLALGITIVGLPVALMFIVRWLFIPQAVMLDGANAAAALRLSAGLVRGNWWRTFGRVAAVAILVFAANVMVLGLIARGPIEIYMLVSAILGAFTLPYFSIAITLSYLDLKARSAVVE
jgi:hypothetical protein